MDEISKMRFEQLEERLNKVEHKLEVIEEHVHKSDTDQGVIMEKLKNIQDKVEEISKKQDTLLKAPTPSQALNKDKADKWDKVIAVIITALVTAFVTALLANIK